MNNNYKHKYIKYKQKYLTLSKNIQTGGTAKMYKYNGNNEFTLVNSSEPEFHLLKPPYYNDTKSIQSKVQTYSVKQDVRNQVEVYKIHLYNITVNTITYYLVLYVTTKLKVRAEVKSYELHTFYYDTPPPPKQPDKRPDEVPPPKQPDKRPDEVPPPIQPDKRPDEVPPPIQPDKRPDEVPPLYEQALINHDMGQYIETNYKSWLQQVHEQCLFPPMPLYMRTLSDPVTAYQSNVFDYDEIRFYLWGHLVKQPVKLLM